MQDLNRKRPALIYEYAVAPGSEGAFTYFSDDVAELLGVPARTLRESPELLFSRVYRDDLSLVKEAFRASGETTGSRQLKVRVDADDQLEWWSLTYSVDRRDGAIIYRGVSWVEEETEKHPDQTQAYEDLLDRLPIGVVIHHAGTVLFANRHAHAVIGARRPGELLGMNALSFVHPDYVDDITSRIKRVYEGAAVPMAEEKFICLDGRVIDVETMAFPFVYQGRAAVQVIFRDITEKKRTESQIRRNETLFKQLFQNLPMAVVLLDENGKVSEVNRGFEEMFGYAKEEVRNKNLNDFIVPENLTSEGIDLNRLITSNRVVTMESVRRHRSGNLVHVILCGMPVIFENEAIGIYGVYVDISDRKKVEEELKVRNAELDNFVYKVSHDLRAPLSSVLGLVNLSRLEGNTDNPLEYIALIGEKVRALDNFIGDVLSHSKNLKMDVDIGPVDLQKIIEQTFTDLSYLDGAQKTRRTVRIEGVDFYSDRWRVSEIFRNLISNAIKYRKPEADDSEIVVKINVDHLCADISFADNGIGIKQSSLSRIFEMFYRATDQGEGSGIGLYIVKNAVEKLGGQIRVASALGEGTRFHLLLPNRISSFQSTPVISRN